LAAFPVQLSGSFAVAEDEGLFSGIQEIPGRMCHQRSCALAERDDIASEPKLPLRNQEIAAYLDEVAELLEAQGANVFRVRAYRSAAKTLRELPREVHEILNEEGLDGLRRLPGIGESLGRSIERLARTGRSGLLMRLRGQAGPEHVFRTLPGIGLETACRIHEQLGIESLQELEAAAHDGRLARVQGMGPKRVRGIREAIAGRFRRPAKPGSAAPVSVPAAEPVPVSPAAHVGIREPSVSELLQMDREYREHAKAGRLPRIAPLRFNPTHESWLPIMHTQRGARHYTALYSNTARAHELGTTHDWVIIYRDDDGGHGQWTVVTARYGALAGRRVVRGREAECAEYYAEQALAEQAGRSREPPGL
jgi:DNA polymerase (family X)